MAASILITASSPAAINLKRLSLVRVIALGAAVALLGFSAAGLGVDLPFLSLAAILAGMAGLTLLTAWRLRRDWPVSEGELAVQFVFDVTALTGLLTLSGGAASPFVMLYLLPLAFAVSALPPRYGWAIAVFTATCYTALLFLTPLVSAVPGVTDGATGHLAHGGHASDFGQHVIGMWAGFMLSAVLIAGFAARMGATVRERDRLVGEMREREMREERVLALGTLAAGAAHELGTPLATLAVVLKDMDSATPVSAETLGTLRTQVTRCKEILTTLSASAGAARAEGGTRQPLDQWLSGLVRRWQTMRPAASLQFRLVGRRGEGVPGLIPEIVADQTLAQALTSVLNNAADASPHAVELDARWTADELIIEVADRGPGLAPRVRPQIGAEPVSTKAAGEGLGLGLFLAHTTLARFGGQVSLHDRDGGGTRCRIVLPLSAIRVSV